MASIRGMLRWMVAPVAIIAFGVLDPARANHYILPCDDDCVGPRWIATGSLATARQQHTATLLPDGRVLVAGGTDSNGVVLSSAELYDPATHRWTSTGSMTVGH